MTPRRRRLLELIIERAYRDDVDIVLASGKRSSFYINGKKITLHPEGLNLLAAELLDMLRDFPQVTAVGGLTLGADPIAGAMCAMSHDRGRPLKAFIVRKETKVHGTGSLVEGDLESGEKVAIVEDTMTTGGSSRKAIDAVRALGAEPVVVLCMVDREDQDGAAFRSEFDVRPVFRLADLLEARRK